MELIAVCTYRLVMVSIKWSQTAEKKRTGQYRRNSNPVATLPHASVVFRMQPFNLSIEVHAVHDDNR